jgi:hypothetical protein
MTSDVAATEAAVAKEIARLRMKERDNRENNVILPPQNNHCARGLSTAPPGVSRIFLGDPPIETPGTGPGAATTWGRHAIFSIKYQFRIAKPGSCGLPDIATARYFTPLRLAR